MELQLICLAVGIYTFATYLFGFFKILSSTSPKLNLFTEYSKPKLRSWALVTGGSEGIGFALAKELIL